MQIIRMRCHVIIRISGTAKTQVASSTTEKFIDLLPQVLKSACSHGNQRLRAVEICRLFSIMQAARCWIDHDQIDDVFYADDRESLLLRAMPLELPS